MKNYTMTDEITDFSKMILVGDEAWNLIIDHKIETPKPRNDGYKPWIWIAIVAIYNPNSKFEDGPEWAFSGTGDTLAEAIHNLKTRTKIKKDNAEIPAYQEYPWFNYMNQEEWDWEEE